MATNLETAGDALEALQAALLEVIAPHLGRPRPRPAGPRARRQARGTDGAPGALAAVSAKDWRRIGRDILALHAGYTQREGPFAHEANPIHTRLAAYQLYYLPRNWYRVHRVLAELPWATLAPTPPAGADGRAKTMALPAEWLAPGPAGPTLHLLDLGCGTGAYSLAWLAWLAERGAGMASPTEALTVHLTLVDQGHTLLQLAQANLEAFARRALPGVALRCETHASGVDSFLAGRPAAHGYAIAGAAMTLNELNLLGPRRVSERAVGLADALQARMRPGGCLLFVEPGTRRGFMNLMTVRDLLLDLPQLYPCPHQEPCPMWGGTLRHWCHATEQLPQGFFFDAVLRARADVRFDMRDLQLAALAVQTLPGAEPVAPFRPLSGERIVSAPLPPRTPSVSASLLRPPDHVAQVVLACGRDGQLHERPAPTGGAYTRGRWQPAAPHVP